MVYYLTGVCQNGVSMRNLYGIMIVTIFALASQQASATIASVTNVFSAGQKIVASQLNQNNNDILNVINGNLDSTNIAPGGVASTSIAAGAVTAGKLGTAAVVNANIADATITNAKFFAAPFSVPTGSIMAYVASSSPTGWLLCDGATISRVTYSELFAVIGTSFGNGNGSTTFNVPDTRGLFLRGLDASATRDADHINRLACKQADGTSGYGGNTGNLIGTCQSSDHGRVAVNLTTDTGSSTATAAGTNGTQSSNPKTSQFFDVPEPGRHNSDMGTNWGLDDVASGVDSRPRNITVSYIIKY